jgi:flagellar protein FliS
MADNKYNSNPKRKPAMYLSVNSRAASAYTRVAVNARVEVATPHELIDMLYDGLLETLALAKGAMERGDIPAKGKAITKAVRLLEEGLKGGLSPLGGELSTNLRNLYDYCIRRLTEANARNEVAAIDEVRRLVQPLAEGWKGIRTIVNDQGAGHA